ncbi:MAG: phosphate ABC transporter substrate-binding protein [Gemmatimonadota bacterium]
MKRRMRTALKLAVVLASALLLLSCGGGQAARIAKQVIQNAGSDTMVNLAQAWAEEYAEVDTTVSVEVSGGGSGTGIAALINATVDIANCSRAMSPEEEARALQNTGKAPQHFTVGFDALAVYVDAQNPLSEISLEQLAGIYGEGGQITRWSQLGIDYPACSSDEIIRVSRQSNSGTYEYFREALLGHTGDFKLGSRDLHGSKDVVELVQSTPCAIGYSGMGYATGQVKMLRIARKTGEAAYPPTLTTALDGTYPIARPLFMYTLGPPAGAVKQYLDWVHSAAGQKIVEEAGYVPLPKGQ